MGGGSGATETDVLWVLVMSSLYGGSGATETDVLWVLVMPSLYGGGGQVQLKQTYSGYW